MSVVIVGNGMAGARLVDELRSRDRKLPIHVFGAEASLPYNRLMLSTVLAGGARPRDIRLTDPEWYDGNDVDVHLGVPVTAIDRDDRTVTSADGDVTPYDTLVLATGSEPVVPQVPGLDAEGVVVFRTIDDCREILRHAENATSAVVVGGGVLGLEAARGLAGRGPATKVVHRTGHLMDRQLDAEAGDVLRRVVGELGVETLVDVRMVAARTREGRVTGVELDDGTVVAADLVVLACGVHPATGLAVAAGLSVDRGILVDDRLRSIDDPAVHAIGDCAQYDGTVYGLVAPAWEQAEVVADVLTGQDASYRGSRPVTRLRETGIELAAMGEIDLDDDEAEVLRFADPTRGTYKKVVIRDDRLVGAILLGETGTAGLVTQLYDRAAPLPGDRLALLFDGVGGTAEPGDPADAPDRTRICDCNNVSKGRIRQSWENGAREVDDIATATRATTGCGSCRETVAAILARLQNEETAAGRDSSAA